MSEASPQGASPGTADDDATALFWGEAQPQTTPKESSPPAPPLIPVAGEQDRYTAVEGRPDTPQNPPFSTTGYTVAGDEAASRSGAAGPLQATIVPLATQIDAPDTALPIPSPEAPAMAEVATEPPTIEHVVPSQPRRAWIQAIPWGVVVIVLTTLPTLLATTVADRWVVEGSFFHANDSPQFLAAINQGRVEGSWLLTNRFSAEPHTPAFIYPFYLALGHVAGLAGWSDAATYQGAALAGRLALWLALAMLVVRLLPAAAHRWAYLLLCTTGGFAVSIAVVAVQMAVAPGQSSFLPPTPNLLTVMLGPPHWALGLTILCVLLLLLSSAESGTGTRRLAGLAVCVALLGLIYPFLVAVALTMIVAAYAYLAWRTRQIGPGLRAVLVTSAAAAPFGLYNFLLFSLDPFWSEVYGASQNLMPSPPAWYLPVYLGVVSIPGVWAMVQLWRSGSAAARIAILAVLAMLVWMYVPLNFQRRAGLALEPLLAILAAAALTYGRVPGRSLVRSLVVAVGLVDSAVLVILILAASLGLGPWPANGLPGEQARVADWLAPQVQRDDVVLAPPVFSGYLASRSLGRVASSDAGTATRRYEEKQGWVALYYAPETPAGERRSLELQLGNPNWLVAPETMAITDPTWEVHQRSGGLAVYRRVPFGQRLPTASTTPTGAAAI